MLSIPVSLSSTAPPSPCGPILFSDPPVVLAHKIPNVLDGTSLPEWKKASIAERLRVQYESQALSLDDFMELFKLLDLPSTAKKVGSTSQSSSLYKRLT
ncbi:unnamed protein product [Dibothriocephalus latus]|uniref:Uncharacterized protein n=1 Tax=Dibothriocephalus latus TaxID=60516 RepID=A0A3P7P789_DIBLA|nr:unnamed protein product [Dibothriocephalus latus]